MSSLNQVNLIGRLGKKAEIRTMQNGKPVAAFSLAVDESYKKDGQKVERTEWVNCVVFPEGLVRLIENYTDKGSQIYLSGKLQTRKWEKDGVDRYSTEVVLQGFDSKIVLLGNRGDKQTDNHIEAKQNAHQPEQTIVKEEIDDDIPF